MTNLFDIFGRPKRVEAFEGRAYIGVNVAVDNSVRQFTTQSIKLLSVTVQALDNDQLIGDDDIQDFVLPTGSMIFLSHIDPSTLYVANATAGQNGTVVILGSRQ